MDYPDPQNWVSLWQTNGVLSSRLNYSNAELDELVKQADVEQDPVKRLELYNEAETILINDVVFVPNRINSGYQLVKPYVQGVVNGAVEPGFLAFLGKYTRFEDLAPEFYRQEEEY